ncbi:MAG: hypothetical protein ACRDNK_05605 [Solirubrobacteraceae bacterium]
MADVYGERIGQGLQDEEWLRDAGTRGWVVLMKDARIRRRPAELEVLIAHQVRAFCLTNANLRGADQAQRLVETLAAFSASPRPLGRTSTASTPGRPSGSGRADAESSSAVATEPPWGLGVRATRRSAGRPGRRRRA